MNEPAQKEAVGAEPNPALGKLAWETYLRDLPRLLEERPGQCVAYHGDQIIGFAATARELYQLCHKRGIPGQEYEICRIEPAPPEIVDSPYPFD
jgi:hypothetical protein